MNQYVYVIQHKCTLEINGCFKSRTKAEKYINGSIMYHILKLEVI